MGFFSNIRESVAARVQAIQEKNEFLKEVEDEAKPLRRAAYLKQMKESAVLEGRMIAQQALDKKMKKMAPRPETSEEDKKTVEEKWGISDPMKYLNKSKENKNGN